MQRNGMGAVNPQALTALTGAGGVQTATIVPDLQSINNGKDVRIETDTSLLNSNQNLTFDNTFYERILNEIRSTSNNSNQIVIQPTLMGHADTSSMCVELQYTATVNTSTLTGTGTFFNCGQLATQLNNDIVNEVPTSTGTEYYGFYQPEWAMLRNITRTQIFLGNNAQLVQRANMNLGQHYAILLNDRKYHPDDYMRYAALGLPVANWFPNAGQGAQYVQQAGTHVPTEYLQANENAMTEILVNALVSGGTTNTGISQNRYVTVPLSALNSFFTEKQFLPPSTKMRIELFTNPTNQVIFYFLYPPVAGTSTAPTLATVTINIMNARFNCVSYLMTQTAQEMDNQRWLTTPKVYNYNTYELVQFPTIANQTIYPGLNLAINQQRPTDVKFRIFNPTAQDTFNAGGTPAGVFNSSNQYAQWYNNSVGNVSFYNLRINISGRLNYELRKIDSATTNAQGYQSFSMCMEDAMNMLINRDTWRAPNESVQFVPDIWDDSCNSVTPTMSLSPGDMQSKDYYSTDQGAVSIYVDLEVWQNCPRQALPGGLLIIMYKKLQEQLLLDAAGSTTIVQWPAIKAEGTKVSIPTTFNQN